MRVTVTSEQRFDRTPNGAVWATGGFDHHFWDAYLEVFDSVRVVARVRDVPLAPPASALASRPGVSFSPMPYYVGPMQHARLVPKIVAASLACAQLNEAYILRVPSPIASYIALCLDAREHLYAVEVVGDPLDVFAPGAISHPTRPLVRMLATWSLRRQCARAYAASYVTNNALQRRYPCPGPSFAASSIRLSEDAIAISPRVYRGRASRLVFVGSLEQLYKGPDVLLQAMARLAASGEDLDLTIIGDGKYRQELERSLPALKLLGRVRFTGWLPGGDAVRRELDRADIFVLPSRTEGLPRAMIEAMARGLPCIGTDVGGIPELITREELVTSGDATGLAERIRAIMADPQRLTAASARNLRRARDYSAIALSRRRAEFYQEIAVATQRHVAPNETSRRHRTGRSRSDS